MIYKQTERYTLYNGLMQDELENLADNSVDSIVTDPPYELNFMAKAWDRSGVAFAKDTWERCLRVLKPGGYLLAFGGSRTFHRIACAIEDAGFEIRDTIMWLYGSGFPKSLNIGLAIDKKKGVESIDTGVRSPVARPNCTKSNTLYETGIVGKDFTIKKATNEWASWGTQLKPSYEPIIIARKPCDGTCVDNVLKWGVGGLNIDECRVENTTEDLGRNNKVKSYGGVTIGNSSTPPLDQRGRIEGRFPANTIFTYDDTDFDEVCGGLPSGGQNGSITKRYDMNNQVYGDYGKCNLWQAYNDSGSAARYFYCAKATTRDRDEGLQNFVTHTAGERTNRKEGSAGITAYAGATGRAKNIHPAVKPTALVQYLIRLVTPRGGTILDPFMGSGSTGKAAFYENFDRSADYKFIGIEMTAEYLPIAAARIEFAERDNRKIETADESNDSQVKFDL